MQEESPTQGVVQAECGPGGVTMEHMAATTPRGQVQQQTAKHAPGGAAAEIFLECVQAQGLGPLRLPHQRRSLALPPH